MKGITRFLIMLSVLCVSLEVQAHQPDFSSTILAEQGESKWVLQVRAALTAFEYIVEDHFGESSYASPEEFQELVVNYIRENVSVRFNDTHVAVLQKGMVKLGHETYATFQIEGAPEDVQSLVVENTSFSDIPRNQSALLVIKEGFAKEQFTLSNSNGHTAALKVSDSRFELVTPAVTKVNYVPFLILAGALLAMSLLYFIFKNRQVSSLVHTRKVIKLDGRSI